MSRRRPNGGGPWSWVRRAVVAASAAVVALNLVPLPPSALADSPVLQTWWTVNNLTFDAPLPPEVVAPGAIPAVTIPSSDVPDGGSEVAGTTDSPTGALTLRYEFPEGSTLGPLVLTLAEDVPPTPATELIACPLTDGRFETHPGGGPISELPESDCTHGVPGLLDEDGTSFRFESVAEIAGEDHLSVAILPVAGRAVLQRALSDSLDVASPERSGPALPRGPVAAPAPPRSAPAPKPMLGQVRVPAPAPSATPAPAPTPGGQPPQEIAERFVTVFRGTAAGQAAGSATAGAVLVLAAAASVWRRGRAALLATVGVGRTRSG